MALASLIFSLYVQGGPGLDVVGPGLDVDYSGLDFSEIVPSARISTSAQLTNVSCGPKPTPFLPVTESVP